MKKFIAMLLTLIMCASLCVPAFAAEAGTQVSLSGFSYEMDGSRIDSKYDYTLNARVIEGVDHIRLTNISVSPTSDKLNLPTEVTADKMNENTYSAEITGTGVSFIIEKYSDEYYIDITNDTECYSFGGDRLQKMVNLFAELANAANTEDELQDASQGIEPLKTAAGRMLSKSKNGIKIEAYWNPDTERQLSIRVNTIDYRVGEWVTRIKVTGYVPSSYTITSANPTGINVEPDYTQFLSYLLERKEIHIFIPSFSTTTSVSSLNGNHFTFDISPHVSWTSMNYSTSTKANGMLMHLFLNKNGVKPVPHGTLAVTEHIVATGSVTLYLSF